MGKVNYQKRWVGQELNDDATRKKFIRHLKRWHNEFATPWWDCGFNRWLVYECTIHPCGLSVESIAEGVVTLFADCTGVQTGKVDDDNSGGRTPRLCGFAPAVRQGRLEQSVHRGILR